jgi:lipopolysaccharide export system protein LptC
VIAMIRAGWDRLSLYLPVLLMGLLALGTYWLVRSTPILLPAELERAVGHDADYFMRKFSVKTFDGTGRLKTEVLGADARHFPDTDLLEIDEVRIRSFNEDGRLTTATASRAMTNGDGSEVQLIGSARVVREVMVDKTGRSQPKFEFRGEYLHAFLNSERIESDKPVELMRGNDRFTADSMSFDNVTRVIQLKGRVKGTLVPGPTN